MMFPAATQVSKFLMTCASTSASGLLRVSTEFDVFFVCVSGTPIVKIYSVTMSTGVHISRTSPVVCVV